MLFVLLLSGMYARPLANGCGILGLLFSTSDSVIYNQLDKHGLPDSLSSVFAGVFTSKGIKPDRFRPGHLSYNPIFNFFNDSSSFEQVHSQELSTDLQEVLGKP
jgi:hypothetical protein